MREGCSYNRHIERMLSDEVPHSERQGKGCSLAKEWVQLTSIFSLTHGELWGVSFSGKVDKTLFTCISQKLAVGRPWPAWGQGVTPQIYSKTQRAVLQRRGS